MLGIEVALLTISSRRLLIYYKDLNVIHIILTNSIISLRESSIRSS